jgi:signal recognition particle 43 kDa protein
MQVKEDFEAGLEYAQAERILDVREVDCAREYLVQWSDSAQPSWESEDNIASALVVAFEKDRKAQIADQKQPAAVA